MNVLHLHPTLTLTHATEVRRPSQRRRLAIASAISYRLVRVDWPAVQLLVTLPKVQI